MGVGEQIRVADGTIAVRAAGQGPPIVLVHGTSCSSRAFTRQLESALTERFRLLAIDLPGHGDSAPAAAVSDYSARGFATALRRALDELDARDAVLVGWSLGGHVVLEAAPELPHAAGYLIFGTAPAATVPELMSAYHPEPAIGLAFKEEVSDDELRALLALYVRRGSELPELFWEDFRRSDPRSRSGIAESVGRGEMRDKRAIVRDLTVPLAVLHGVEDAIVRRDFIAGVEMPTLWRGAIQDLDGVGHAAQWEAPARFNDLLSAFASECHARP